MPAPVTVSAAASTPTRSWAVNTRPEPTRYPSCRGRVGGRSAVDSCRSDGKDGGMSAPAPPADDEGRLRSLAAMARALGRPHRVEAILELAAEEALSALGAASVSVSRWEPGEGVLRTLINVGELS